MAEEGGATSIAARIAALNLKQVGQVPSSPPPSYDHATNGPRPRPPPPSLPQRRPGLRSSQSGTVVEVNGGSSREIGNQPAAPPPTVHGGKSAPALPPRKPTSNAPSLPARRPSETPSSASSRPSAQLARHGSRESIASNKSGHSVASNRTGTSARTTSSGSVYTVKAPEFDPASLPPLPPKRHKEEANAPTLSSAKSTPNLPQRPALPQRPSVPARPAENGRRTEPPPPRKSALSQGFGFQGKAPALPSKRPTAKPSEGNGDTAASSPPPIHQASRPDLSALKASKPKPGTTTNSTSSGPQPGTCLLCRDFTQVDAHAARFPLSSIPSHDPPWIAHQLTSPFPSSTDKARAIFTWLHHNIAYNTKAFFSNNLQPSTPSSTISTGLAVCEGYASLFTCLATHAGLQSRVIGGHGKGYGYAPLSPGSPIPPYESGHAWNAVHIETGWKLLDACWGAGTVDGATQSYKKGFNASEFTKPNADFGRTHFPEDGRSFFRDDGRCPTWGEYLTNDGFGDGPRRFGGYTHQEGVSEASFEPKTGEISLAREAGKTFTRFSFTKVCPHWDNRKVGGGAQYCYILLCGPEGRERRVPFETNGWAWWVDVGVEELGGVGGKVMVAAVTAFDGGDGRGLTARDFREKEGRVGMGWGYVCEWDVVR
ncbi:hypothetical protein BDZ85DRAFT_232082 [Elsinoe ampelina]|uniref:Transglutaminase-like domain-containing protein n=1 Tax=Elsinoe ampelina TaxID=302913 RepID=A0A6A6GK52_9PEZI|nr:hypothetical protein BDZ85DRAFT_232082 [Elsinoe ampelina]